jgi:hypothetical protein
MATTNKWTPNETQKIFMSALADGSTRSFKQINSLLGKEIKTGAVNTLTSKGLVEKVADGVTYNVKIVETRTYADGTVVVIEKEKHDEPENGYRLVSR